MPSSWIASRFEAGSFLGTNPPFAPFGTMTTFFACWAFARLRISVRKSSCRSDQRTPPREIGPPRRWMPSKRGEWTKISAKGFGAGSQSHFPAAELEGDGLRRGAVLAGLVEVGAQRRADQTEEVAQDAVVVENRDLVEALRDARLDLELFGVPPLRAHGSFAGLNITSKSSNRLAAMPAYLFNTSDT